MRTGILRAQGSSQTGMACLEQPLHLPRMLRNSHFWVMVSFLAFGGSSETIGPILWAPPSAAGPRPLHFRIADSRHYCKRILVFFGTPTCHLRIFGGFFWDTREYNKRHFEVQAWISIDFWWIFVWLLVAPTFASWGALGRSWDDPGTMLGHWREQRGTLRGPGSDFVNFLMI